MYKLPTLPLGTVLQNRYQLLKKLGGGGFGAVYLAEDTRLHCLVAVKELLRPSANARVLFQQEAEVLARLDHPHLVKVSDFFEEGRSHYLVMDYVAGQDLLELAITANESGRQLAVNKVLRWMVQVCEAATYLHTLNPPIIHRDIKPANIRLDQHQRAILVDFGIAKIDPKAKTQSMAQAVSRGFSPPEQYEGGGRTDARSDVYALGATTYCLLTLTPPPDSFERLADHRILTPPTQRNPQIPKALETVILKALALDPSQRYQTARELLVALQQAVGRSSPPDHTPPPATIQRDKSLPGGAPVAAASEMTCPHCGSSYRPLARFCPNCGYVLQTGPRCPHCGARNRPGARFCAQCRAKLA